jgi:hypothetical protein
MSETKSLKQILNGLTPSQVWALLVAIVTVLSGSFGLGVKLSPLLGPANPPRQGLVPCFKAAEYPLGDWLVSGDIVLGPKTMLAPRIIAVTPTAGTVLTNEKNGVAGKFTFDRVPAPNQRIHYQVTDETKYEANMDGLVSDSGCSIEGQWSDTNQHSGNMTLFWFKPKEFWVKDSAH